MYSGSSLHCIGGMVYSGSSLQWWDGGPIIIKVYRPGPGRGGKMYPLMIHVSWSFGHHGNMGPFHWIKVTALSLARYNFAQIMGGQHFP